LNHFDTIITTFEKQQLQEKEKTRNLGVIYTPLQIAKFMVKNTFKMYLENLDLKNHSKIDNLKVLDPACGSGRFLIAIAEYLFVLFKTFNDGESTYNLKKKIIENNLYGNDIEKKACIISKIRLLNWLYSEENINKNYIINQNTLNFVKLEKLIEEYDLNFNIFNEDFLFQFKNHNFDIIIGNPPYIENKRIHNPEYKKRLAKQFYSAYKLYDLSTLFIERSITLLRENKGCLCFLTPNKFLAADYGIKIRELLLKNTQIREIVNISSLPIFKRISAYPIILFLIKTPNHTNAVLIKNSKTISDLRNNRWIEVLKFKQELISSLPSKVVPVSGDVELINQLYSRFNSLAESFKDLRIIYRPFGFIDWAKNSKYIKLKVSSDNDLVLLGTGNIKKYHIDFNKHIKIAHKKFTSSYFQYNEKFKDIWYELSKEKLIFREIAKNLTFTYDPGLIVNLTGLYFVRVPSLNTNQIFSLLAILNSELIDNVFKSLYGTLHMSGGYLRINGSFIKSLPMPKDLPESLAQISKIISFLSQLKYDLTQNNEFLKTKDIKINVIDEHLTFFQTLSNLLVNQLYEITIEEIRLKKILKSSNNFPDIPFKFFYTYSDLPQYRTYTEEELCYNFKQIENFHQTLISQLYC